MILAGLCSIVVIEIYTSVMQLKFQNTDNKVGKAFAVLGIYLFVIAYCKWHTAMVRFCIGLDPC